MFNQTHSTVTDFVCLERMFIGLNILCFLSFLIFFFSFISCPVFSRFSKTLKSGCYDIMTKRSYDELCKQINYVKQIYSDILNSDCLFSCSSKQSSNISPLCLKPKTTSTKLLEKLSAFLKSVNLSRSISKSAV